MTCLHTRVNGSGDLATCANPMCAVFVSEVRDEVELIFDRARAGLSAAKRTQEAAIRERCVGMPLLRRGADEDEPAGTTRRPDQITGPVGGVL